MADCNPNFFVILIISKSDTVHRGSKIEKHNPLLNDKLFIAMALILLTAPYTHDNCHSALRLLICCKLNYFIVKVLHFGQNV